MRGNLKIMVGVSASGKSTYAHQLWLKDPMNTIIVSRDNIRKSFGYDDTNVREYYLRDDIRKLERLVTFMQDTQIYEGLEAGKTVIVDNTHLKRSYIDVYRFWNVPTQVKIFETDLMDCLHRNSQRVRQVDEDVIKKQHRQFVSLKQALEKEPIDFTPVTMVNDSQKQPVVVVDLDNTLCMRGNRSPYEWHRVGEDEPCFELLDVLYSIDRDKMKVIICTGRDGICINETEAWLFDHGVEYDEIHIRPKGNSEPDWVIKERMWRRITEDHYIAMLIDDRNQVVRRARALGLKVMQVEYGNF